MSADVATGPGTVIASVRFRTKHRCFNARRALRFQAGVNLLVGDQGTGKSSLIRLIREAADDRSFIRERAREVVKLEVVNPAPLWSFDFEKDNHRTRSEFGESIHFQVAAMFASHGQASMPIIEQALAGPEAHAGLVLLDEPDTALSPRSARRLGQLLAEHAERGGQSIVAVHNPIVIASQPKVLSLEHKRWMGSEAFLASHAEPRA